MNLLRILSFISVTAAAAALGRDIFLSFSAGRLASTSLGALWFSLHPPSLNLFQAVVERYIAPVIWDPYIVAVLKSPAWLDMIVLAVILLAPVWLFRRRTRS